jgi:putative oxidoreductase
MFLYRLDVGVALAGRRLDSPSRNIFSFRMAAKMERHGSRRIVALARLSIKKNQFDCARMGEGGTVMSTIPGAMAFADLSLLFLRVMLALVFGTSGYSHLAKPKERAASIGMSVSFTVFLGVAEMAGSIALVVGFLAQWAALGLILIMLGAISMKAFKWHTGFWGEKSMGWHYDLLMIVMNLVIVTMGPGKFSL